MTDRLRSDETSLSGRLRFSNRNLILLATGLLMAAIPCFLLAADGTAEDFPTPAKTELKDEAGRGVQRFMRRLEESTPQHKNTVRVLFYGQSITEQRWTVLVSADLRRRFPNVNFVIENRAIGGFASDKLVLTAEADLYPFYPDLLVFYDYGRHDRYEDMIRRTRERTTSEIILQTDHLNSADNLSEETDPAKLSMKQWSSWFPNVWIPTVAAKYGAGLVQQRALWKIYCRDNHLDPVSLTIDGAHLNDQGNFLMAKIVEGYLVRRSQYDDPAVDNEVRDYPENDNLKWAGNKLVFPFTGNKIDLIAKPGDPGIADVLIDGKKPSDFPELYQPTRVSGYPGIGWPVISRIDHRAPLVLEAFTATESGFSHDGKHFKFSVRGSVTGPDGEGDSDHVFVSRSGRVVISPEDWNIDYSFGLMQGPWAKGKGRSPFVMPQQVVATWQIVPFFTDTYSTPAIADPAVETPVTLAQGLSNGPHVLQLIAHGAPVGFKAFRVYEPALPSTDRVPADALRPAADIDLVPKFAPPVQKVESNKE